MVKQKLNAEWHNKNKMPKNPSMDQRIQWHLEHQNHCNCRGIPEKLVEEINKRKVIKGHDTTAQDYDKYVDKYKYYANDAIFGLCYEFIKPKNKLLDLGIGTGLSSQPFANMGLVIYGLDGSNEMLRVCEKKGFTKELKLGDIQKIPLPYKDQFFEIVISGGVFNFIKDLSPIFKDVYRILKMNCIFAFTILPLGEGLNKKDIDYTADFIEEFVDGVPFVTHNNNYIERIVKDNNFKIEKELRFIQNSGNEELGDVIFHTYVVRKV